MKPLKFAVLTDTHYYSKKNWVAGNFDDFPPENGQLLFKYSEEIIKHTFHQLCEDEECNVILIGGDLTFNGEVTSHKEMKGLLADLKNHGRKVFVITATHDYNDGFMPAYGRDRNNNPISVEGLNRDELLEYYGEFGYNTAIAVHKDSMSYVAQLDDKCRLLALNDDYGNPHCGFSEDCMQWIKQQVEKANEDNQFILAMTHHPLVPPSAFYKWIGANDMMYLYELRASQLADMGIQFVFTGHSHIHNISSVKTKNGNVLFDISTAALTGFPPAFRQICVLYDERKINIKSQFIDHVPNVNTDGLTLTEYTKKTVFGIGFRCT